MSENKLKIQLSRHLSIDDKSSSPTKLMINHGKPNFTIKRQNGNYKKFHEDKELKSNEIDKIVLKNVSLNVKSSVDKKNVNGNNKIRNDQEFLQKFRKISIKNEKTDKTTSTQSEINQKQEFLDKFQQISEKLSTRDIDSIETSSLDSVGNTNGNCVYNLKVTNDNGINKRSPSKVEPQFSKMVDNRIKNAALNDSGFILPPGAVCGKPYIPSKPEGIVPSCTPIPPPPPPPFSKGHGNLPIPPPPPPPFSNGHRNLPIPRPVNGISTIETKNEAKNQNMNGVNFEQKSFVSFSRDLYTAPNSYPDTAKVVIGELKSKFKKTETLNDIGKLKFDIATTGNDVIVTSVIR